MYVCMPRLYVCLGQNHAPETRSDSLRKPFSIWHLIHLFKICERGGGGRSRYPESLCPWGSLHTYIHTSLAIRNPRQREGFWKTAHRHRTFETYIPTSQSAVCYKYAFQNHSPCEGFLQSLPKTPLPVRVFPLSSHFGTAKYVCSKPPLPVIPFAARHPYILA